MILSKGFVTLALWAQVGLWTALTAEVLLSSNVLWEGNVFYRTSQKQINSSLLLPLLTISWNQKAQNLHNPAVKLLSDCLDVGRLITSKRIHGICYAHPVYSCPCPAVLTVPQGKGSEVGSGTHGTFGVSWAHPHPAAQCAPPILSCHQGLSVPKKPCTDSAPKCFLFLQNIIIPQRKECELRRAFV